MGQVGALNGGGQVELQVGDVGRAEKRHDRVVSALALVVDPGEGHLAGRCPCASCAFRSS